MLARQLAVLVILFVLFNGAVAYLGRRAPARVRVHEIDAFAPRSDALFAGNSLMDSGFDAKAFVRAASRQTWTVKPLKIACGATHVVEHLVLLHRATEGNRREQIIVYGFFDFQLTDPPEANDIRGNRALAYYVEPNIAARYYTNNKIAQMLFVLKGKIPYIVEQGTIWEKVEKARRRVAGLGMPAEKVNGMGRVADFAALEQADVRTFDEKCHQVVDRRMPLSAPVREFISVAAQHSPRVVIIEMPLPPLHRKTFYARPAWGVYQNYMEKQVRASGAEYVRAADWVGDASLFADALHLNEKGAQLFSTRLADELAKGAPQQKQPK